MVSALALMTTPMGATPEKAEDSQSTERPAFALHCCLQPHSLCRGVPRKLQCSTPPKLCVSGRVLLVLQLLLAFGSWHAFRNWPSTLPRLHASGAGLRGIPESTGFAFTPPTPGVYAWDSLPPPLRCSLQTAVQGHPGHAPLVYTVQSFAGGVGDRVRGLAVGAYLALVTQRPLVVAADALRTSMTNPPQHQPTVTSAWGTGPYIVARPEALPAGEGGGPGKLRPCLAHPDIMRTLQAEQDGGASKHTPLHFSTGCMLDRRLLTAEPWLPPSNGSSAGDCSWQWAAAQLLKHCAHDRQYACGAALLHAAWGSQRASTSNVHSLVAVQSLFAAWQGSFGESEYAALHMRAGGGSLDLLSSQGEPVQVPALPYFDGYANGLAKAWLVALRAAASGLGDSACRHKLAIVTDSMRFRAEAAGVLWDKATVQACCQTPLHVSRTAGLRQAEVDAERQVFMDLFFMSRARVLFTTQGGFGMLGASFLSWNPPPSRSCAEEACVNATASALLGELGCDGVGAAEGA